MTSSWIRLVLTGLAAFYSLSGCASSIQSGGAAPTSRIEAAALPLQERARDLAAKTTVAFLRSDVGAVEHHAAPRIFGRVAAKGKTHVFLSDAALNVVYVFTNGVETGTLEGFNEPQGLATDKAGILYVADTLNNSIKEYAPPYQNPPAATIVEPGEFPVDVAVGRDGTVAALNVCAGPSCSDPGGVDLYAKGSTTTPCASLSGAGLTPTVLFGAFDAKGTLFYGSLDAQERTQIAEIRGGCAATSILLVSTSNSIGFPGGVQVDPSGDIAIGDSSSATLIDVYAPPRKRSTRLKLKGQAPLSDTRTFLSFALTASAATLFTAELNDSLEYPYPAGGSPILQLVPAPNGGDLIEGVAVTPAEVP